MKTILNAWILKYLTIFIFISAILYGIYHFVYYTPYEYIHYSNESTVILKINKTNGEVYRFSSGTGQWTLLSK